MHVGYLTRYWYTYRMYREKQKLLLELQADRDFFLSFCPEAGEPETIEALEAKVRSQQHLQNPTGQIKKELEESQKLLNRIRFCKGKIDQNQEVVKQLAVYLPLLRHRLLSGQVPPISL